MVRIDFNSLFMRLSLRLFAIIWMVIPVVSVNAQGSVPSEKIQALELPSLSGEVMVYYSEGYSERAAYLQEMAVAASKFLEEKKALGIKLDLTVAVLDSADWAQLTKLPYGISHILSDSPTAILPASEDNILSTQYFAMRDHLSQTALNRFVEIGVSFDDAVPMFVDLIGFHEIGHIYSREYGTWPTEKWLSEFIATYLAYAFMTENRPKLAEVWDVMSGALGGQSGVEHTSLADFERLYMGVGGANYGWYQARFQQRVEDVYEKLGMSFMHSLKISLEKNPESLKDDPFRLRELDAISEGFTTWAKGPAGNLK